MPSGKHRVFSVSGRHYDDRVRQATGVSLKASENLRSFPIFSYIYRLLTKFAEFHNSPGILMVQCRSIQKNDFFLTFAEPCDRLMPIKIIKKAHPS